jgi:hypothetical protein
MLLPALVVTQLPGGPSTSGGQGASGAPLRLHAEEGLERLAEILTGDSMAWLSFPGIGDLRPSPSDTIDVWLVRDLASLAQHRLGQPEEWVAGLAVPEERRIALRVGSDFEDAAGLRGIFRHELAHLALHEATGGHHPTWLGEGYAQFAAGLWGWDEAWQLRLVFFREGGGSLRDLDLRFRRQPLEVRLGYLLSYTAVHELAAMGGEAGLAALFARLRAGDSFDAALRRVFGVTEEQFETRWKRGVLDRYGWVYVLSRAGLFWVAVSILLFAVTARRVRQDRRRLEALRAEEMENENPAP